MQQILKKRITPEPGHSFAVIALPGADSALFFGPQIDHFSRNNGKGIREKTGEIGRNACEAYFAWEIGNFTDLNKFGTRHIQLALSFKKSKVKNMV